MSWTRRRVGWRADVCGSTTCTASTSPVDEADDFVIVGGSGEVAVHVLQVPPAGSPGLTDLEVLDVVGDLVVQLSDASRVVVIGPASALTDRPANSAIDLARDAIIRGDRLRAAIRLPRGLVPRSSRRMLALWALGPAHPAVPVRDRWTVVADVSDRSLDEATLEGIVTDVVAAMAPDEGSATRGGALAAMVTDDTAQVRGHQFRFARRVPTSSLLLIVALRPDWHADELDKGRIKVVYSGDPTDTPPVSNHVRRDGQNKAIKARLTKPDDELEIVIVKDMMLTGFDAPPLHTLYLDRPLKGALLMQTLARVNRTFRGKQDGLLVAYAPLAENLQKALAEYSPDDQSGKPLGRNVAEAVQLTQGLIALLDDLVTGYDWRADYADRSARGDRTAYAFVVKHTVNHLRDPRTPGNEPRTDGDERETLTAAYRRLSSQLSRAWALCGSSTQLHEQRPVARFYEEVRVWMAKLDAAERESRGEPIPEDIQRLLGALIADSTQTGEVLDIYAAAGMPKPSLMDLSPDFLRQTQEAANPHLAIEALRDLIARESVKATGANTLRQQAFSGRIADLMRKYTNQQLTSAEVIAELIALAQDVVAEAGRGASFTPPLDQDELAYFDAVTTNESAVNVMGEGVLADIARELVAIMRRDIRTDWTVREDVRAKLRTSIKRLLIKHGYPPDEQPAAIKLVLEQMEAMAPRFAQTRADAGGPEPEPEPELGGTGNETGSP